MTTSDRKQVLRDYNVNEQGVITSPGKFEGEMLYAPFFWGLGLEGLAERDNEDGSFTFELTDCDKVSFPELMGWGELSLYEDEQGFVHVSLR